MIDRSGTRRLALVAAALAAAATGSLRVTAQDAPPVPTALYAGLTWRCVGPFDGGPVASVEGTAGVPGTYLITTPTGSAWRTEDGGGTWIALDARSGAPASTQQTWTDPSNPRRIARVDADGIAVSLDGGSTWFASHNLPIAVVPHLTPHVRETDAADRRRPIAGRAATVSIADRVAAGLVFAGTSDGLFVSFDAGVRWSSLRLNMPDVAITDLDIRGNDLVAATNGRSVWTLEDISPLRQIGTMSPASPAAVFKPSEATLVDAPVDPGDRRRGVPLDYFLAAPSAGPVTLEVIDVAGRVVHAASSAASDAADRWLPVTPRLDATPGQHRVLWNLRFDPPPAPHHRFEQLARSVYEHTPAEPDGPLVWPGAYRVRLTVDGRSFEQPLTVSPDPTASAATRAARRRQFDLAVQAYDAMDVAHRAFRQLLRLRAQIKPLLASPDVDLAAAFVELDGRLNAIDGSDYTGLVIPDVDDEPFEDEAKEGKHPDFVPPKPVGLSKDYDDPTSILGRAFGNVDHAPAFAILATSLGGVVTKAETDAGAPDALARQDFVVACQQLAGVLDDWRGVNAQDVPRLNAELAKRRLPPLAAAGLIPSIACPQK